MKSKKGGGKGGGSRKEGVQHKKGEKGKRKKKSRGERVEKETGRKNYQGIEGNEGVPGGSETNCQCRRHRTRRPEFDLWVGKIPWRREWQPTPIFLPGEFHGQRSQVLYSPWGYKASDMT